VSLEIINSKSVPPLYRKIEKALKGIQTLGCQKPDKIHYLIHYSRDIDINGFELRRGICCWTTGFSIEPEVINGLTADMDPRSYQMIYAIKIGMAKGEALDTSSMIRTEIRARCGWEYELAEAISPSYIAKIPITLNGSGTEFV